MPRPKGLTGRAPILSAGEFERVLEAARSLTYPARDRAILLVSFYLGLRAKEIASLRFGDVYTVDGEVRHVLHIKRDYSKKNRMRDVYLSSDRLRSALASYRLFRQPAAPDHPLFATRSGKAFSPNGMVVLFGRIYRHAGFEASSHSGRRTMITRLAEQGVDLKAIATLAGHASITTTCIYVEENPARLARIMAAVEL